MNPSALDCPESPDVGGAHVENGQGIVLRDFLAANYKRLHQRLLRHLGCPDLASDSLHDAWLRMGETAIAAMIQSPEAYVYRVACNLATDRLRAERSWQYVGNADVELDYLVDPAPGPASIAEVRSDIAAVDRTIQRLPRRHRAVLVALRIDEMSRREVATRYDISLRSVDTALRQALDRCAAIAGCAAVGGVTTSRRAVRSQAYL